ncbi:MAG: hybrid sensor histidine kinase/response regulator [Thermoflexales bacterium]|nr:hybrid sensor histidine kinase/response regulator [Thermoflexales bacterium]
MTEPRILVVDDSEIIREMLASFLGTLGYRVDVAPDGQSALDKFLVFRYQLIISDLQMPFVEGLSLLKQVKAIAAQTQVIILTGHATLDSAVEALRLGAYDYQFKPLDNMESFARLVDRALKHYALLTENERLVEELRQANAQLESQVAERTRELQIANESLLSLDRLKNDFISVVSHELRTPLAAVVLQTQMLTQDLRSMPPDKLGHAYTSLATNTRRLQIQIDNLLDFALIERGELDLNFKPCSMNQIARDVVDLYEARAAEKHLNFTLALPPTTALSVIADGPRLRSALVHLVDNAVKFTPEGGTITISVHGMATMPGDTEPAVAIAVRDNGIGIPPELQQKLFTGFNQADMSTTRRYGGMGIGLALAARIAAAHRGKITFKSELGNGSLFALWVPTRQPESYQMQDAWRPERMLASMV